MKIKIEGIFMSNFIVNPYYDAIPENLVEAEDSGLTGALTMDADTLKGHGPEYFASVAQMTAAIQDAIQSAWEASY